MVAIATRRGGRTGGHLTVKSDGSIVSSVKLPSGYVVRTIDDRVMDDAMKRALAKRALESNTKIKSK